jgi:uncharacterized delta-60 repeat protein
MKHLIQSLLAMFGAALLIFGGALRTSANTDDLSTPAAGELDPTFGAGGKVVTAFSAHNNEALAVAIQADGKILVAGFAQTTASETSTDFLLARYNRDGTLDTGFGTNGKVTTDFFGDTDWALALKIQRDGGIVAAGFALQGTSREASFALARYNSDGSLDSTFGAGGKVVTSFPSFNFESVAALALQDNGKLIAVGTVGNRSASAFGLARYNTDGTLDASFGSGGSSITRIGARSNDARAIAIQPDGKIIVTGAVLISESAGNFALLRYNADGTLDTAFMGGGVLTTSFFGAGSEIPTSLILQPDGKIIVAGRADRGSGFNFALARYNPDGSLDASFGSGGKVTTNFFGNNEMAYGVVVQPDGKLVVGGAIQAGPDFVNYDFGLVRYNVDGSVDASFGTRGKTTTDFSSTFDIAFAIGLESDGRIIAAGGTRADNSINSDLALARYQTDLTGPRISAAEVQGKNLIVKGTGFDPGAKILINSEQQKSSNDELAPSEKLIGKKAGKRISRGETVAITVRNPSGALSPEFSFTRAVE